MPIAGAQMKVTNEVVKSSRNRQRIHISSERHAESILNIFICRGISLREGPAASGRYSLSRGECQIVAAVFQLY